MPGGANYKNPLTKEQKRQTARATKLARQKALDTKYFKKSVVDRKSTEAWREDRKKKDAEWDKRGAAHKAKRDSTRASNDKKKSVYDAMMKQKKKK